VTDTKPDAGAGEPDRARGLPSKVTSKVTTKVTATVTAGKTRVEGTPAADLVTDLKDADLINKAMNFAALVLMIFFPFIITLASLSPLNHGGAADVIVRKMGLSGEAAVDVEKLFNSSGGDVVVYGWTFMGFVWLVIGGIALSASLEAIYREIWALPSAGLRGFAGQILWLASFILFATAQTLLGDALTGTTFGQICYGVLAFVLLVVFIWVGGRVLLLGKLTWRQLLPTAVFTAIGLTGLGIFSKLFFASSIVSNERIYGSIGVVFIILSWLIGIGVVVTGGAIVGSWYVAREFSFLRWVRRLLGGGARGDDHGDVRDRPSRADAPDADAADGTGPTDAGSSAPTQRAP
jgi:membrane protein